MIVETQTRTKVYSQDPFIYFANEWGKSKWQKKSDATPTTACLGTVGRDKVDTVHLHCSIYSYYIIYIISSTKVYSLLPTIVLWDTSLQKKTAYVSVHKVFLYPSRITRKRRRVSKHSCRCGTHFFHFMGNFFGLFFVFFFIFKICH